MDAPRDSDLGAPFDVVVLAAGRSSRMGEPKGLVTFRGRPWLLTQLDAIASVGGRAVIVLGADRERYLQALPDLPQRARLAFNDDPDRGPFSSLQCGLAAATPDAAVFVLPVDVPAASGGVWGALREALAGPRPPTRPCPRWAGAADTPCSWRLPRLPPCRFAPPRAASTSSWAPWPGSCGSPWTTL